MVLMEGVITLIIVAALFYVAPGVMASIATAAPAVCSTTQPALYTAQTAINGTAAGALNLASIGLIKSCKSKTGEMNSVSPDSGFNSWNARYRDHDRWVHAHPRVWRQPVITVGTRLE